MMIGNMMAIATVDITPIANHNELTTTSGFAPSFGTE